MLKWEHANKVAIILTILTGFYFIWSSFISSSNYDIESQISINKFQIPEHKRVQYDRRNLQKLVPPSISPYTLANDITDSIFKKFELKDIYRSDIKTLLWEVIPREYDGRYLITKIDSIIQQQDKFIRVTRNYIYTFIKNEDDKILSNLSFELPSSGYYELYLNENLVKQSGFRDEIKIGNLKSSNKVELKIWCYNLLYSETKCKYTFNNGNVEPTVLESIEKGTFYWIYENPGFAFMFLLIGSYASLFIYFVILSPLYQKFLTTKEV